MSIEYDSIVASVTQFLDGRCGAAVSAYPFGRMKNYETPVIAVSVEEAESTTAGAGDYLGIFNDAETGERELYGRYLEVTLGLHIYSPDSAEEGANACQRVFGQIVSAFSGEGMPVKVKSLRCGDTEYDEATGMYHCRASAKCRCFMTAEILEDGEFTDYILKGVMIR